MLHPTGSGKGKFGLWATAGLARKQPKQSTRSDNETQRPDTVDPAAVWSRPGLSPFRLPPSVLER